MFIIIKKIFCKYVEISLLYYYVLIIMLNGIFLDVFWGIFCIKLILYLFVEKVY